MMEVKKKLVFSLLESDELTRTLITYCDLLKSHYHDRYKIIINSCNNKLLAYHYSVTLNHVEFNNPVCYFISCMMKGIPYSGLYYGIVTSAYLSKILKLLQENRSKSHHKLISTSLDKLKNIVFQFLDQAKEKADLEGYRLISIVKSTLTILSLEETFTNRLAISIVKASLIAADESSRKLGHISIRAIEGKDNCEAYSGVLYKLESFWVPKILKSSSIRILLFTEPLNIISDSDNHNLSVTDFIDGVVSANIQVIACQKSIDKKIIFLLRRNNIFALERLGEETANALGQLSGAFHISDYKRVNFKELNNLTGIITRLRCISIMDEDYLLLENDSCKVVTLFVSHRSFDTLDQLKAVIKESIHAIYSVFKEPYFLPVDFDATLAKLLRNFEDPDVLLKRLTILFAETIEEASPTIVEQEDPQANETHRNTIFIIKRNSLAQAFLAVANLLQVGLFVVKN